MEISIIAISTYYLMKNTQLFFSIMVIFISVIFFNDILHDIPQKFIIIKHLVKHPQENSNDIIDKSLDANEEILNIYTRAFITAIQTIYIMYMLLTSFDLIKYIPQIL